ncbi:MAG: type II CRISPR-associated endonuclease Cas1 [Candidatus Kapaibacterium sp.]
MFKRILCLSNPAYLKIKGGLLNITMNSTGEIFTAPPCDIALIILDNKQITITQSVIEACSNNNIQLIACDETHHPVSALQSFNNNNLQLKTVNTQLAATEPMKKQLWQMTIKAKLKNQAAFLDSLGKKHSYLIQLMKDVKSGDSSNREAIGAKYYWKELFGKDFKRDRYGKPPNNLLNFGYTITRASVARAISSSGLLPLAGYHHHNQYNAYCLADDLIEPYRPFVDKIVFGLNEDDITELNKNSKAKLLSIIYEKGLIKDKQQPIINALRYTTASLVKFYEKKSKKIEFPELI